MQTIKTAGELQFHTEALIARVPSFAKVYELVGLPRVRLRDGGFVHVCQTIVSQQLSVAAAETIWQRLQAAQLVDQQTLLSVDADTLRACGLSKQKIRYLQSLASHDIDYEGLVLKDDETVIDILTAVLGIGRWTAEIYLLFSLNRSDVFAANDLALQVATQALFGLPERPKERAMRELAQQWSPHRSAAAYLLWAYYRIVKGREGINN